MPKSIPWDQSFADPKTPSKKETATVAVTKQERKKPVVLLHINVEYDLYHALRDIQDKLNNPHQDPSELTLEELQLVAQQCKAKGSSSVGVVIDSAFAQKRQGPLRIPGVGALRTPHGMAEVINTLLRYAVENAAKVPLPDHTAYDRAAVDAYIRKQK